MSTAQRCGLGIFSALIAAGADIRLTHGSGMTPLGMALLNASPRFGRSPGEQRRATEREPAQMVDASLTDPRSKAIIQRAPEK